MTTGTGNPGHPGAETAFTRFIRGDYFGFAQTYWGLYIIAALLFFAFGSVLVADRNWIPYTGTIAALVVWSFVLLTGVQRHYKGSDPGKALGRIAMLFLLLNLTNVLATLSFI